MSKIIIHNNAKITDYDAILRVQHIISEGKVSNEGDKAQYCYHTKWKDKIGISCDKRNETYTFKIAYEE